MTSCIKPSCFTVVDACQDSFHKQFDFIFSASVLHMLVEQADRKAFLQFFHDHLTESGKALILTMGDGATDFSTNANTAYVTRKRITNTDNTPIKVPNLSCKVVSFETFAQELADADLNILESGITESLQDFNSLMYAMVSKGK